MPIQRNTKMVFWKRQAYWSKVSSCVILTPKVKQSMSQMLSTVQMKSRGFMPRPKSPGLLPMLGFPVHWRVTNMKCLNVLRFYS